MIAAEAQGGVIISNPEAAGAAVGGGQLSLDDIHFEEEAASFVKEKIVPILISNVIERVEEKERLVRKTQELNLDDQA